MHRRHTFRRTRQSRGMSLLELCIVVSILLILAAMLTPRILTALANTRLRGSATEAANFLQRARLSAIRNNRFVTVRYVALPNAGGNFVYADTFPPGINANDGSGDGQYNGVANGEALVNLGRGVQFVQGGNPIFGANLITSGGGVMTSGDAPLRVTWSARGLPCVSNGITCTNPGAAPIAYAYFLNDGSANGWAAVTVSAAGRIKVWMWTGAAWQ